MRTGAGRSMLATVPTRSGRSGPPEQLVDRREGADQADEQQEHGQQEAPGQAELAVAQAEVQVHPDDQVDDRGHRGLAGERPRGGVQGEQVGELAGGGRGHGEQPQGRTPGAGGDGRGDDAAVGLGLAGLHHAPPGRSGSSRSSKLPCRRPPGQGSTVASTGPSSAGAWASPSAGAWASPSASPGCEAPRRGSVANTRSGCSRPSTPPGTPSSRRAGIPPAWPARVPGSRRPAAVRAPRPRPILAVTAARTAQAGRVLASWERNRNPRSPRPPTTVSSPAASRSWNRPLSTRWRRSWRMASPATTHPAAEAPSDSSLPASGAWAAAQAPLAGKTTSRATTRASAATRASLQRRVRP